MDQSLFDNGVSCLYPADARALPIPSESVDCVVTSPPYWGLRDYGIGGQLGLEATPQEYVASMVEVFREIWRVLKPTGTVWLNLGDSYHSVTVRRNERDGDRFTLKRKAGVIDQGVHIPGSGTEVDVMAAAAERFVADCLGRQVANDAVGLGGDECDIWFHGAQINVKWTPRDDGQLLCKLENPPHDLYVLVTGRTVDDLEIKGWATRAELTGHSVNLGYGRTYALHQTELRPFGSLVSISGRLKPKDLVGIPWRVAFALQDDGWYLRSDIIWSKPNPMPESVTDRPTRAHEYIFLLTKAERYYYDADAIRELSTERSSKNHDRKANHQPNGRSHYQTSIPYSPDGTGRNKRSVWEITTQPYPEAHFATFPEALVRPCVLAGCPSGGTVLDPFAGSGTTIVVAQQLGRRGIGIELNPEYVQLAIRRLSAVTLPMQLV